MKRFSYYNINGWICLYLALKNNLKKVKKGVDKRGAVWYNSKAHLRNGSAEAVQEWVMHLEN